MTKGCQEQGGEAKEIGFWFGSLEDGGAIHWDKEQEEKQVWGRLRKSSQRWVDCNQESVVLEKLKEECCRKEGVVNIVKC